MDLFRETEIIWEGPKGGHGVLIHIRHRPNWFGKLLGKKAYECKYVSKYGHVWYRLPDFKEVGLYEHDYNILSAYASRKKHLEAKAEFSHFLEED